MATSSFLSQYFFKSSSSSSPKRPQVELNRNDEMDSNEDIIVFKMIGNAKFTVYLSALQSGGKKYALKVFENDAEDCELFFNNESRFSFLQHPNIIKIFRVLPNMSLNSKDEVRDVPAILMEYAPYETFYEFLKRFRQNLTEKLIRTYFRQLIEAIEYIHGENVCHLDLKLDNLLVGEDYQLKICDFDLSYMSGDLNILTKGTKYYRAPELRVSECKDGMAADIYSAGVILFMLKTGGVVPHNEEELYYGVDFYNLLDKDCTNFFKAHCKLQEKKSSFFDESFKDLFLGMTKTKPEERIQIKDIKRSKWYNGAVYSNDELKKCVKKLFKH